ncbi:MAG: ATP-binding protein [Armatimonadota bacterium]|nr:ATP-binding protein [Armatimonadota bacterium]
MAFEEITWQLPAEAGRIADFRKMLRSYLGLRKVCEEDIHNVQMILGEACTNVVRHAYSSPDRTYQVKMRRAPGKLILEVTDEGVGFDCANPKSRCLENSCGMGLVIIKQLANRADIESRFGLGTRLRIEYALQGTDTTH